MADAEDIQPLVCDNGTGMVKVKYKCNSIFTIFPEEAIWLCIFSVFSSVLLNSSYSNVAKFEQINIVL